MEVMLKFCRNCCSGSISVEFSRYHIKFPNFWWHLLPRKLEIPDVKQWKPWHKMYFSCVVTWVKFVSLGIDWDSALYFVMRCFGFNLSLLHTHKGCDHYEAVQKRHNSQMYFTLFFIEIEKVLESVAFVILSSQKTVYSSTVQRVIFNILSN